jgi:hypothetical protein
MTQGPTEPGPTGSAGPGDDEDMPGYRAREQVTQPRADSPAPSAYPPTQAVPSYQPTAPAETIPPYQPTVQAQPTPSYQPTVQATPSYQPTELNPGRQADAPRSDPTVIAPQARPYVGSREQATVIRPSQPGAFAPPVPPTSFDPYRPPPPNQFPSSPSPQAPELVRYGPGVPPSQAGVSAEQVWRTGQIADPPKRPVRYRRLASLVLTVVLLAAAGVLLFLRFHHSPFHVSGAPVLSAAQNGCTVNVTGRIPTNGASGTISYQWVFTPQQAAPQPLSQSVVSGQHDVFVTVAVQGQGHGTATEQVTLQVLGPNQESASTVVKVSC